MSSTLEASVFMGKNYSENLHSIEHTGTNLTMKQMFDISEKLVVGQSNGIYGVTPINWEDLKKSSVSRTRRCMYFQILCCVLERWIRTQHQILLGKKNWVGSRVHHSTELWTQMTESLWNSSGIFSKIHFIAASSSAKSKSSCLKWAIHQNLKDGLSCCRCSKTSHGDLRTMDRNAMLTPTSFLSMQEDFHQEDGHSSDLDQKRSGILLISEEWDRVAELMMIKFRESGHPVFRATSPLSRGTLKKQRRWKIINTHLCRLGNDWNSFSHNNFC